MISLTMIHGWGVNAHIFDDFRHRLPESWQIHTPHLAGHGGAPLQGEFSIIKAADELAAQIVSPTYLLGWSLGSQIALHIAARYPEKVRGMILMSGFAKLRAADDYPQGVRNDLLDKMVGFFQQDYARYVRQFLELQLLNTPEHRPMIDKIMPDLVQYGAPQALQAALNSLEAADARAMLPEIAAPALMICGNKDSVTPPRMSEYLAQHLPHAQLHIIDKAAHAPFLSHAAECVQLIEGFVE
ncbi:pimeloyl-ACP methyl ester esterase BioH [Neisseriaceae bacterium B1]